MKTLTIIATVMLSVSMAKANEVETVKYVDLSKYIGTWYEVASFPQSFQKDCFCSRAQYHLKSDGRLGILNSCNLKSPDGKLKTAKGYAKIVDPESNSKLKATFFWPFFGDYWIIGLDENYRYAVVSSPDRSTLWVLSRTPLLDSYLLQQALDIAASQGLDLSKLEYRENEKCKYE